MAEEHKERIDGVRLAEPDPHCGVPMRHRGHEIYARLDEASNALQVLLHVHTRVNKGEAGVR